MHPQQIERDGPRPAPAPAPAPASLRPDDYLQTLALIERLHRLLLDVIKDEFERLSIIEINAVQGLMLFNIADLELTAGELRTRGCYQGSNVSYNLKKLVELGYMHHKRCNADRRAVRVRLAPKGHEIRARIGDLLARQAARLSATGPGAPDLAGTARALQHLERFWAGQIRYIY